MIQLVSHEGRHMIQLTHGVAPRERFKTQYGIIDGVAWLEAERQRIARQPGRVAEIREDAGKMSLWVDCQAPGCSCKNPPAGERGGVYRGD
jgi:hypothetical protein